MDSTAQDLTPARPLDEFADVDDALDRFRDAGYLADDRLATTVFLQTRLGKPLSLMAGSYRVKVNSTLTTSEVKLNQVTELKTGSLVVEGSGVGYHVTDQAGALLEYKQMDRVLSLFPGVYNVEVGEETRAARIEAGRETRLKF